MIKLPDLKKISEKNRERTAKRRAKKSAADGESAPAARRARKKRTAAPEARPPRKKSARPKKTITISLPNISRTLSPQGVLYCLFGAVLVVVAAIIIVTAIQNKPAPKPVKPPADETDYSDIKGPEITEEYTYRYDKFGTEAMVEYKDDIEVISFGAVIGYPHDAFASAERRQSFDETCLTPSEFTAILQSLYDKKYIVVSISDIWQEAEAADGSTYMERKPLKVPKGRKPIALVFKGENLSRELADYGFAQQFVQQANGEIWATANRGGHTAASSLINAVTLMDDFVKKHDDFCLNGAKGCIALTGNEGLFGYDTSTANKDNLSRRTAIVYARSIIKQLRKTGWYFGCYTYGGIDIQSSGYTDVISDLTNWVNEVGLLIGSTDIFIYPSEGSGSAAPLRDGDTFEYMQNLGFNIYVSEGTQSSYESLDGQPAVIYTSMNIDGHALRWARDNLMHLFDSAEVFDNVLRPDFLAGFNTKPEDGNNNNGGNSN